MARSLHGQGTFLVLREVQGMGLTPLILLSVHQCQIPDLQELEWRSSPKYLRAAAGRAKRVQGKISYSGLKLVQCSLTSYRDRP